MIANLGEDYESSFWVLRIEKNTKQNKTLPSALAELKSGLFFR